jgi:hypothetical protein
MSVPRNDGNFGTGTLEIGFAKINAGDFGRIVRYRATWRRFETVNAALPGGRERLHPAILDRLNGAR